MSLRALELAAVVAELATLKGARVDAVRVHAERALTLELHGRLGEARLLLSAEADVTRLHAAATRPPAPETPYGWQGLLRRELEGARLTGIEAPPGDRVVRLTFDRSSGPVSLVAELTGRHGNLFLVDAAGLVRSSASRNLSTRRDLSVGQPYRPPAPTVEATKGPSRFTPVAGQPFPLSLAIERHYAELEAARRLAEARRRLREPLRAAAARLGRALGKLAEEQARVPAAEADRRLGDLLKLNLASLHRGARSVTLTEWTETGPRQVTVPLDPALGPRENMERHYRRFRRIVESAQRVEARAAEVRRRRESVASLLAAVELAPLEGLARLEREARALGAGPRLAVSPRRRDQATSPYRTYRSPSGVALLVGKGAEENDELTRRARGNDLWLHARGITGAHVVARLAGRPPDQETLLDAAHLAAHFSDARGAPQVEVAATRVKYVKKVKGAAPGAVTYSQERVLLLRVEPERLARLLAAEEGGADT
jgi:predicted ribosome quality control (RQC) complex YloA/Tae2 family protein